MSPVMVFRKAAQENAGKVLTVLIETTTLTRDRDLPPFPPVMGKQEGKVGKTGHFSVMVQRRDSKSERASDKRNVFHSSNISGFSLQNVWSKD